MRGRAGAGARARARVGVRLLLVLLLLLLLVPAPSRGSERPRGTGRIGVSAVDSDLGVHGAAPLVDDGRQGTRAARADVAGIQRGGQARAGELLRVEPPTS